MASHDFEHVSKQMTIVVGLPIVGFMAFGLALSFYRNALFDQTLMNIEQRNQDLRDDIQKHYRDLAYYRSHQYRDKYAKENLGLVNPGEKVLVLQKKETSRVDDSLALEEKQAISEAAYFEILRQMPFVEHWRLYLFDRKKEEDLRKGL